MGERSGVLMAVASSALGGTATALIRFMVATTDPIALGALRFGLGAIFLLPAALVLRARWPRGRDWIGVLALGCLFFGLCFALFNAALVYTTAARGALAMSTLPLLTMIAGAVLGIERLTFRKATGVLIAIGGVATALVTGLAAAPKDAWHGDLIMIAAASCMALYNVWSRPLIKRSGPLAYVTATMAAGASLLAVIAGFTGGFAVVFDFGRPQWIAILYLGLIASSLSFFLWVSALERTTPTRVANTLTVNPVTASILAALILSEPIGLNLLLGVIAVAIGIWIASTEQSRTRIVRPLEEQAP
jgi:drug/metabolite transporter (DMT)-like permease